MSAAKDKENKKAAAAVATKDVVAAVPEKRKRGRKPKSSETSVAEGKPDTNAKENTPTETPNEAKNSKKNEKEEDAEQPAAKKTKTTKALKENAATTPTNESRPSRDRKTTEHYTYPKKEVKEPKKNSIPEGNGTPLRDIKSIHEEFSKAATDDDILRGFHGIVFGGRAAQKHIKSELLQFNGFNFASDKEHDAALGKLERFTMAGLKDLANLLCVESSGNKETVLERVWEFLKAPSKDAATNSRKRRRSSGAKKDDESDDDTEEGADKEKKVVKKAKSATTKLPSSKTVAASTAASPGTAKEGKKRGPKPKPKTPFEVYAHFTGAF
ncbi:hypothetical protein DFS34DRAFT_1833 [Phlyctochytrium arcticum]|nr:hypothetical protein DFS34DRAFT_1833 [Phlyctochytrium arcticum]